MKIYKRTIQGTKDIYIGKTTKSLNQRTSTEWFSINHKIKNNQKLSPVQQWMYENKSTVVIELIEEVSKESSCKREDYWINKFRLEEYRVLNIITGVDHRCLSKGRSTYCYSLEGEFLKEFKSLTSASEILSISIRAITSAEISLSRTAGGFMWRKYKMDYIPLSTSKRKKVYRILDDGSSDMVFSGTVEASKFMGVTEGSLSEAKTLGTKCVGYRWSNNSAICKYAPEHKIGVTMYDVNMNKLKSFSSFREAARVVGAHHKTISIAVASEKLSKGYYWKISD